MARYEYKKTFEPAPLVDAGAGSSSKGYGDSQTRSRYHYGDDASGEDIVLAVNVALATHRPLLLRGAPGCGKSSLARDVARVLERTYYEYTVTSRTAARDLCWQFDTVRRLSDAHSSDTERRTFVDTPARYVVPGPLWWAFDPASAALRGQAAAEPVAGVSKLKDPGVDQKGSASKGAVLLIDEIDKAEPDVPNDLLVPLGSGTFSVDDLEMPPVQSTRPLLLLLTTNEERDLPPAFIRRCVVLELKRPTVDRAMRIARSRHPVSEIDDDELRVLATRFEQIASDAEQRALRAPGTAEFLDAIAACIEMNVKSGSRTWEAATNQAFWKHPEPATPFTSGSVEPG